MLIGSILVILILVSFLRYGRLAVISLTAIPLSILTAGAVLIAFGASINGMTLGGLAIAVGEVVDDAIVDVENVWRRLRENAKRRDPLAALDVVRAASREIRGSVVYATIIVAIMLIPVLLLGGIAGRIFSPLAHAYILAISASLLVALTVTPALCAWLLPPLASREPRLSRLSVWMLDRYRHVCAFVNGRDEEHRILDPFVTDGLTRGEKALYLIDAAERANLVRRLGRRGLDMSALLSQRQCDVRTWTETYLRGGRFDQEADEVVVAEHRALGDDRTGDLDLVEGQHVDQGRRRPGRVGQLLGQTVADVALRLDHQAHEDRGQEGLDAGGAHRRFGVGRVAQVGDRQEQAFTVSRSPTLGEVEQGVVGERDAQAGSPFVATRSRR